MGHDYQVPVDKHDSDKENTPHPDPLGGVKGRIFKFRYNSVSGQYFYGNFAFRQRYKNTKHIKRDFRTCRMSVPPDLGDGFRRSTFNIFRTRSYCISN